MKTWTCHRIPCTAAILVLLTSGLAPVAAFSPKEPVDNLDLLVFVDPQQRVVETLSDAEAIRADLANIATMDRFRSERGPEWRFTIDQRRGVPSLVGGGAIPFIPGPANTLSWQAFDGECTDIQCLPESQVEALARQLLRSYEGLFMVDEDDLVLDPDGSLAIGSSIYFLRFEWRHEGIPVEGGSIFFRINNGNLVQIASEKIGPIDLVTEPTLSVNEARQAFERFLGESVSKSDVFKDKGTLKIIAITPENQDPDRWMGEIGAGIAYRLVYRFAFLRPGSVGTWEGLVDAHTGEVLRFVDANRYGRVHGGAYPGDNHVGEADRPFPFADTGLPAPNQYADAGGRFPGDDATTTLFGKYTWVTDYCGSIDNTTTDGDVDFSLGAGTDCDVPDPNNGGPGNTHSARTQYWHLTNVNIKARTYMESNNWLNNDHMNVNTNQSPWCNATSGSGILNFYKAASGCWNLGELPGVSLHEWGHSMDDVDGSGGDSPPVETRADWTAILQTHDSCVGRGFFLTGECGGYGDSCLDCNGVRDGNYHEHENATPWTPANHGSFWSCSGGSYFGPCGLEDHCESGIATQALWELVHTDLTGPPGGTMDLTSAWTLADRLFYTGMPTLGSMYSCSPPNSSGCNGAGLYNTLMAVDDDGDGTANGTPHAAAIFTALNRNNIACGTASDPENQNYTTCPSLTIGILNAFAGNNSVTLSWDAVPNATRYLVFRNEIGCDAGFTKVGEVGAPATGFTDSSLVNGIEYYFRFQAAADSDSCVSPISACTTVTPQPCAGLVELDRVVFNCVDTITASLIDSDLTGVGTQDVTIWSTTESAPETLRLVETPADSGKFEGLFMTTSVVVPGDGAVGVVDGDTITVRYHDASYCGSPQDVDTTAAVDCAAPQISGVGSSNVTGNSADINWLTDEPADSMVVYENTIPPGAYNAADPTFVTDHGITLMSLEECTQYAFEVSSADPAGNASTDTNGGQFFTFKTTKDTQPTYTATDTPVAINDNQISTSVIPVIDDKPIQEITLALNLTHTYTGDLEISLIAPNDVEIMLVDNRGSSGDDFVDTVFDDEASQPITAGSPPFTGSFRPEQPLSTFDGLIAAGDWTLKVRDTAWGDEGQIEFWSLTFFYPWESCPSSEGWIELDEAVYGCSATMEITVQDLDLLGTGNLDVEVWSDTETGHETVTLTENPMSSGVFLGAFPTSGAAPSGGDGFLSISSGDTVSAQYVDADDGLGGQNLVRIDTADGDCAGPVITNVTIGDVTGRSALVSWETTEASDSTVNFDITTPPTAFTSHDPAMVISHEVLLEGLAVCTDYFFYVESADVHSNIAIETNSGQYFSFTTGMANLVDFGSADTPISIPDDEPAGIQSVIVVADNRPVTDVDVMINITHTYDGDLDITLVGPDGTRVELTSDNGSSGENFIDTVFDDEALVSITDGSAPFTGAFQPEGSLATLDGVNAAGDWTLEVVDDAGIDTGTLNSWNLILTYVSGDCDSLIIFADGFETGDTSVWSSSQP